MGFHMHFLFTKIRGIGAEVEGPPILILPKAAKCLRPGLSIIGVSMSVSVSVSLTVPVTVSVSVFVSVYLSVLTVAVSVAVIMFVTVSRFVFVPVSMAIEFPCPRSSSQP